MTEDDDDPPLRECLTLTEYIELCQEALNACFDQHGNLFKDRHKLEVHLCDALEILDDMSEAEWVDTSEDEDEVD